MRSQPSMRYETLQKLLGLLPAIAIASLFLIADNFPNVAGSLTLSATGICTILFALHLFYNSKSRKPPHKTIDTTETVEVNEHQQITHLIGSRKILDNIRFDDIKLAILTKQLRNEAYFNVKNAHNLSDQYSETIDVLLFAREHTPRRTAIEPKLLSVGKKQFDYTAWVNGLVEIHPERSSSTEIPYHDLLRDGPDTEFRVH